MSLIIVMFLLVLFIIINLINFIIFNDIFYFSIAFIEVCENIVKTDLIRPHDRDDFKHFLFIY